MGTHRKWTRTVPLLVAGALAVSPAAALAQACVGSPAAPGQYALGAAVHFSDVATGYSLSGGANLEGPLAVAVSGGTVDISGASKNLTHFGASMALELPTATFATCPVVGLDYFTWGDTENGSSVDVSGVQVPLLLGLGVKADLEGGEALIPSGTLGLLHTRARFSTDGRSETDSETSFYASGGVTVAFGQFFVRGGVAKVFEEGEDPTLSIQAGLRF